MNCRTAKKHILARLDEVLPAEHEAALQRHMHACKPCGRAAQESDLAFRWLQEVPDVGPSENFEWRLKLRLAQLDRAGTRLPLFDEAPARRRWTLRFTVSAAAAALLVLSVGMLRFQPTSTQGVSQEAPTLLQYSVPQLVPPSPQPVGESRADLPRSDWPQVSWPRPVPVRYGAPLGPQYPQMPAPSILGPVRATADTIEPQLRPAVTPQR